LVKAAKHHHSNKEEHMSEQFTATAVGIMLMLFSAVNATAQGDANDAFASLDACVAAAEAEDTPTAIALADAAEEQFRSWLELDPNSPDARTGLARVMLQCRVPFLPLMEQGALSAKATGILREALELDSTHWGARYTLALTFYYSPEFLGRTRDAIRELETLLEQQGTRTDTPEMAGPFAYLGDLYLREELTEAAHEVWLRGAQLFPNDDQLRQRLDGIADGNETGEEPDENDPGVGAVDTAPTPVAGDITQPEIDYEVDPLVARVESGYQMEDTRSQATLSRLDVYMTPGGAADILQVFQTLPGVTRASEGSELYVRGGDPAETPVYVEGGRLLSSGVFETFSGSVFGILDPSVLRRAYFSSGGFSARYGNALSGVVDLETDRRPTVSTWRAGVNFAGGGATLRKPFSKRAGAWASLRFTETSFLLRLHDQASDYQSFPRSLEGVASWVYEPRPGVELKALALGQTDTADRIIDAIGYRGPFGVRGRTALGLFSARVLRNDADAAFHTTVSWSEHKSDFEFGTLDRERSDRSLAIRVAGDIAPGLRNHLRAGFEVARLSTTERGRVPTTEQLAPGSPSETLPGVRDQSQHLGTFVENEFRPVPALGLIVGARIDRLPGEDSWTLDPRFALAYRIGDWTWRLGAGEFQQGRWRVGYNLPDGGAPAGIPRRARHYATGLEREGNLYAKVEAYLKEYDRYVPDGEGPPIGTGKATGVDLLARWTGSERWDGWVSYSYLSSQVELVDGQTVSATYDVPHTLTTVGQVYSGSWMLGVTARYATGRPFTPILGAQNADDPDGFPEPLYGDPSGARLDDYFRLDARITRFVSLSSGLLVVYLELLNVLDRDNVSTIVYDANFENPQPVESIFAQRTAVAGIELQF
jgi:tetratricopeptide (TPR) repeat protein